MAGLGAMLHGKVEVKGGKACTTISGGNINMGLLGQIIEKGMMAEGLRDRISMEIPDQAGALERIVGILDASRVSLYDMVHERSISTVPVGFVQLTITFNAQGYGQLAGICAHLEGAGIDYTVLQ